MKIRVKVLVVRIVKNVLVFLGKKSDLIWEKKNVFKLKVVNGKVVVVF